MCFLRKMVATAAVALALASPLAGAESHFEWLVGQLQITDGEHFSYGNRAFPKAFSSAEMRVGPQGKKAAEAAADRDTWLLQQLQLSDGNYTTNVMP